MKQADLETITIVRNDLFVIQRLLSEKNKEIKHIDFIQERIDACIDELNFLCDKGV